MPLAGGSAATGGHFNNPILMTMFAAIKPKPNMPILQQITASQKLLDSNLRIAIALSLEPAGPHIVTGGH
jgi:hypothetical protein